MILSFKKKFPWGSQTKFKEKILSGVKTHTIREDKHGRWTPGRLIHFSQGVRTKFYECFLQKECVSVQSIKINHYCLGSEDYSVEIIIDGDLFYSQSRFGCFRSGNLDVLAKNDGFDSVEDFFKWFKSDFEGRIIHWSNFMY